MKNCVSDREGEVAPPQVGERQQRVRDPALDRRRTRASSTGASDEAADHERACDQPHTGPRLTASSSADAPTAERDGAPARRTGAARVRRRLQVGQHGGGEQAAWRASAAPGRRRSTASRTPRRPGRRRRRRSPGRRRRPSPSSPSPGPAARGGNSRLMMASDAGPVAAPVAAPSTRKRDERSRPIGATAVRPANTPTAARLAGRRARWPVQVGELAGGRPERRRRRAAAR